MKKILVSAAVLTAMLLLTPLFALTRSSSAPIAAPTVGGSIKNPTINLKSFKVLIKETGEIKELSAHEYIVGVVAAEMPALYPEEALKAQAVAAYTFACFKSASSDKDYALTDEPSLDQAYLSNDALKEKWGDKYTEYRNKISAAVKAVEGEVLCYEGQPALTVYHAISSGKTNPSSDVWGRELPYLKSQNSVGDKLSRDYISNVSVSAEELSKKLGAVGDNFSEINATDTGLIKSVKFGAKSFSGAEVQKALGLKSAAFSVEKNEGVFYFTVYGYGHGVGMSQCGAQYMALQGSGYKEILYHYYVGCSLIKK